MKLSNIKPKVQTVSTATTKAKPVERERGRPWMRVRRRVLTRDRWLCQECKRNGRVTVAVEVDHIVPVHMGGSDDMRNLQSLCRGCHRLKSEAEERVRRGEK